MSCPAGTILNPESLHCVKITGRRGRQLIRDPKQLARIPLTQQQGIPGVCKTWQVRNPYTKRCIKRTGRTFKRVKSRLSLSKNRVPSVAPTGPPEAVRAWSTTCRNRDHPPLTPGSTDTLVRLHTGLCLPASRVHASVAAEHRAGRSAHIPGSSNEWMTIEDFRVLQAAQRRHDPSYRVPRRTPAPNRPDRWQLQVVPLNAEFVTASFVDPTGARPAITLGVIPKSHPQTRELLMLLKQRGPITPVSGPWSEPWSRALWGATPGPNRDAVMARLVRDARSTREGKQNPVQG